MGGYNASASEIADVLDRLDVDSHIEGDYTEAEFIKGARIYIQSLRDQGCEIPMARVITAKQETDIDKKGNCVYCGKKATLAQGIGYYCSNKKCKG